MNTFFIKIMRYSINMSRQAIYVNVGGEKSDKLEIQGSEVQGSGRFFFALAKSVIDLIDDELTVSDAHKCAGKKEDNGKRALRMTTGAVNKATKQPELGNAFLNWLNRFTGGTGT